MDVLRVYNGLFRGSLPYVCVVYAVNPRHHRQDAMSIPSLPSKFCADYVTVVIDTREQRPADVAPLKSVRGTLVTGDYSIKGLEDHIGVTGNFVKFCLE